MKIFAILLILLVFLYVAIITLKMYQSKLNFWTDFEFLLQNLQIEMDFCQTNILMFFENFHSKNSYIKKIIQKYKQNFTTKKDLEIEDFLFLNKILRREELVFIFDFLSNLGRNDLDNERKKFEKINKYLEFKINNSKLDLDKKGRVYFKLTLMAGACLCIIII